MFGFGKKFDAPSSTQETGTNPEVARLEEEIAQIEREIDEEPPEEVIAALEAAPTEAEGNYMGKLERPENPTMKKWKKWMLLIAALALLLGPEIFKFKKAQGDEEPAQTTDTREAPPVPSEVKLQKAPKQFIPKPTPEPTEVSPVEQTVPETAPTVESQEMREFKEAAGQLRTSLEGFQNKLNKHFDQGNIHDFTLYGPEGIRPTIHYKGFDTVMYHPLKNEGGEAEAESEINADIQKINGEQETFSEKAKAVLGKGDLTPEIRAWVEDSITKLKDLAEEVKGIFINTTDGAVTKEGRQVNPNTRIISGFKVGKDGSVGLKVTIEAKVRDVLGSLGRLVGLNS